MEIAFHVWNRELRSVMQIILTLCFEKISLKMVGTRSLLSLKNSVARICRFLMCIGTDLSVSKSFSKADVLSMYTMRRHLWFRCFVLLFIVRL